jgi:hypothetical protein
MAAEGEPNPYRVPDFEDIGGLYPDQLPTLDPGVLQNPTYYGDNFDIALNDAPPASMVPRPATASQEIQKPLNGLLIAFDARLTEVLLSSDAQYVLLGAMPSKFTLP